MKMWGEMRFLEVRGRVRDSILWALDARVAGGGKMNFWGSDLVLLEVLEAASPLVDDTFLSA